MECCARNPCCVGERGRLLSSGRRRRSRILAAGQRRDMGQYPDLRPGGFPGFGTGTIVEIFQMAEISDLL